MHSPKMEVPSEMDGLILAESSQLQVLFSPQPFSTIDIAQRVSEELKTHLIPQLIFAEVVLGGLDQGSVCKYLKYPTRWEDLSARAKATYEKMAEWLQKPEKERITPLREAVQRRQEEREAAKGVISRQRKPPSSTTFACGDLLLDTIQIAARVKDELRLYNIPQGVFARQVAGTSHSTCCTLLKHPDPLEWIDETGKPKNRSLEPFRRMANWLSLPAQDRLPKILAAVEEEKHRKEQAKDLEEKKRSSNSMSAQPGCFGALEDLLSDYSHNYSPPVAGNSNDQQPSSWLMANYSQHFDPRTMQILPQLPSASSQLAPNASFELPPTSSNTTGGTSTSSSSGGKSKLDHELELLRGVGPEAYAAWWKTKGREENASELVTMLKIVGTEALKEMLFERAKQHAKSTVEITIED